MHRMKARIFSGFVGDYLRYSHWKPYFSCPLPILSPMPWLTMQSRGLIPFCHFESSHWTKFVKEATANAVYKKVILKRMKGPKVLINEIFMNNLFLHSIQWLCPGHRALLAPETRSMVSLTNHDTVLIVAWPELVCTIFFNTPELHFGNLRHFHATWWQRVRLLVSKPENFSTDQPR